jgi:isoleucyl-tRNA synthetase
MQTLGRKFRERLQEMLTAIAAADPDALAARVQASQMFDLDAPGGSVTLAPEDVIVALQAPEGWVGASVDGIEVLLDIRVSEELAREGLAREVVRRVQDARKNARLNMEDHISLCLDTESVPLRQAIEEHRTYIGIQTQADEWVRADQTAGYYQEKEKVTIDGAALRIALRKK